MLKIDPSSSHLDHIPTTHRGAVVETILTKLGGKDAFFIETIELPDGIPPLGYALYGPAAGDPPILEADPRVYLAARVGRPGFSRVIDAPMRESDRRITVIGGPAGGVDGEVVLYTVFGGPLTSREPFDPDLPNYREVREARAFWAEHALSQPRTPHLYTGIVLDEESAKACFYTADDFANEVLDCMLAVDVPHVTLRAGALWQRDKEDWPRLLPERDVTMRVTGIGVVETEFVALRLKWDDPELDRACKWFNASSKSGGLFDFPHVTLYRSEACKSGAAKRLEQKKWWPVKAHPPVHGRVREIR